MLEREREKEKALDRVSGRGRGRGKIGKIVSRLHAQYGAQPRAHLRTLRS